MVILDRMTKLNFEATKVSPEIILDMDQNIYSIKGKSVVEEVDHFYDPVLNWLDSFGEDLNGQIQFIFDLEYFNIFSSKRILFVLYRLSDLRKAGADISILWHFSLEDDDMKEVGEDFACMVNLPFEFICKTLHNPTIS